jgi:protein-disulfide isomerase
VVLVLAAVLTAASGGTPRAHETSAKGETQASQIDALLAGIPQNGDALGSSTAPVTLQFFGDLECPTSRAFTLATLPTLIETRVRRGQLRIEYRSLQTATREAPVFMTQQAAALAAGMQHHLWNYVELFYHEQGAEDSGYVTRSYLNGLAAQIPGLNVALWRTDSAQPQLAAKVASDEQTAARLGFQSTPSFLIGKTGETPRQLPYVSPLEIAGFELAIEHVLGEHPASSSAPAADSGTSGRRVDASYLTSASPPSSPSHRSPSC